MKTMENLALVYRHGKIMWFNSDYVSELTLTLKATFFLFTFLLAQKSKQKRAAATITARCGRVP